MGSVSCHSDTMITNDKGVRIFCQYAIYNSNLNQVESKLSNKTLRNMKC